MNRGIRKHSVIPRTDKEDDAVDEEGECETEIDVHISLKIHRRGKIKDLMTPKKARIGYRNRRTKT